MALLFTGFPGFIGTALLPRVVARNPDEEAVCLVQPHHRAQAEERVKDMPPDLAGRVRLVDGDISRPGLGMSTQDLPPAELSEIWHLPRSMTSRWGGSWPTASMSRAPVTCSIWPQPRHTCAGCII